MGMPFIPATGVGETTTILVGRPPLPDLVVAEFQAQIGLGETVAAEQVVYVLRSAQIATGIVLSAWLNQRGDLPLTEDEADLYRRAVYAAARAELISLLRSYDSTKSGDDRAERLNPEIDVLMAQAHTALNHLMGRSRATVELV